MSNVLISIINSGSLQGGAVERTPEKWNFHQNRLSIVSDGDDDQHQERLCARNILNKIELETSLCGRKPKISFRESKVGLEYGAADTEGLVGY